MQDFPLNLSCKVLRVSRSGYYKWFNAPVSKRARENIIILEEIRQEFMNSKRNYGSPRIHAALKRKGRTWGRGRIERLMRKNGIRCRYSHKFRVSKDPRTREKIAPNLLNRNFSIPSPNRVWVSDVTYLWTKEGWLHLSATIDLYSRRVVGWSMSERLDTELVVRSLQSAIAYRQPTRNLIHHSDQGKEFASKGFRDLMVLHKITPSMSRKGDCWDNAVAESFFKTLKTELVPRNGFATRSEARGMVFEWIEMVYNRERLHSTLGYLSPALYEAKTRAS